MAFKNPYDSHDHSLQILELLYTYDSFLDSLSVIADFGCGTGLDVEWWATLETRDEPPEPRDFLVFAVDQDTSKFNESIAEHSNVKVIQGDFEQERVISRNCDLLWCHDAFQYAVNPLQTLKYWNMQMNVNGMLVLSFPQNIHYQYNRLNNYSYNGTYYNHNIVSLMYMLAVNGFDCKDAYFYRNPNDPWLYAAVYKSTIGPMDPKTTTWFDLIDANLVNDSVAQSMDRYGHIRQEDLLTIWLDRDFYRMRE